jgi:antitoxin component YwqK of YwqJK toxin-antitoxin module
MRTSRSIIPSGAREKIISRDDKGCKQVALYYKNGTLIGHRNWDEDGRLAIEYAIRNDVKHGPFAQYHPNGQVSWATRFVDEKEHGISRQYDEKGKLIGTYRMRHGTGVDLWYTAPGELSEERYLRDGKWNGFERWWNTDHSVWEETHFRDNVEHGIKRVWTARGRLRHGYPKYFISGSIVTKRQYERACELDTSLPRYRREDDSPERELPTRKRRRQGRSRRID